MGKIFQTLVLLFVFSLFLVPTLEAQPPFQQSPQVEGFLIIETAYASYHKLGVDFYVHTHVYNGTGGLLVTEDIDCYYHFYQHGIGGNEHLSAGNLTQYGDGFFAIVNGSLINKTGEYSTLLWCESDTEGGFFQYSFFVSATNTRVDVSDVLIIFIVFLFFGLIAMLFYFQTMKPVSLPLKITYIFGTFFFLLMAFNLITLTIADTLLNPTIINFMEVVLAYSFYVLWFYGVFLGIVWIITFFLTFKEQVENKKRSKYD